MLLEGVKAMNSRFPSIELPLNCSLVLDASALINLLGTGIAGELVKAANRRMLVEDYAFEELRRHPLPEQDIRSEIAALLVSGLLQRVSMEDAARTLFRELTDGDLTAGLDDGEAATIAYAMSHAAAIPVIDEKKASAVFAQRWASRTTVDTVTLLGQADVISAFTDEQYSAAIHSALLYARMRVPKAARPWIRALLGNERAAQCPSLGQAGLMNTPAAGEELTMPRRA
jgi:predicted nucleic acid-binding protein